MALGSRTRRQPPRPDSQLYDPERLWVAVRVSRRRVFPAVPRALQWVGPPRGCLHGWCRPWSSKPVGGVNNAPSGFDSHTLPSHFPPPRRPARLTGPPLTVLVNQYPRRTDVNHVNLAGPPP